MEIAQKNCGLGTGDDQNKGNFLYRLKTVHYTIIEARVLDRPSDCVTTEALYIA